MADGPAGFTQDFSCPALLRVSLRFAWLRVRAFHPLWNDFPDVSTHHVSCGIAALQPPSGLDRKGLGSSPFARHYLGNHCYFLFLRVLRCFSSPRLPPPLGGMTGLQPAGLSHSEIRGSKDICSYPRLFAACHVLHRLQEPRHPPYALSYLLTAPCRHGVSACSCTSIAWFCSGTCSIAARPWILNLVVQYVKDRSPGKGGVENNGFEPLTPCLQSRCSSQLS